MIAKEKATGLINKMLDVQDCTEGLYDAKQSAIVAVDEEVQSLLWLNLLCGFDNPMKEHIENKIAELKEVKEQIGLL